MNVPNRILLGVLHLHAICGLSAQNSNMEAFELSEGGKMLLKADFSKRMPAVEKDLEAFNVLKGTLPSGAELVDRKALVAYLNSDMEVPASVRLSAIRKFRSDIERIYGESDIFPISAALLESLKRNSSLPGSKESLAKIEEFSRSVGLIVPTASIADGLNGKFLRAVRYGFYHNLCPGTPDFDTPCVLESGTGFLTSGGQVVTAGHCVDHLGTDLSIIFGYSDKLKRDPSADGNAISVYLSESETTIRRLILLEKPVSGQYAAKGDWALLSTDKALPASIKHLELEEASPVLEASQNLFMIGHPCGLPLRVAAKGRLLHNVKNVFRTNLDSFIGDSGAPVFHGSTWKVEGVLIHGGKDFQKANAGKCNEWVRVAETPAGVAQGTDGEAVGRIGLVVSAKKRH